MAFAIWMLITSLQQNAEQLHRVHIHPDKYQSLTDLADFGRLAKKNSENQIPLALDDEIFPEQEEFSRRNVRDRSLINQKQYEQALANLNQDIAFELSVLRNPKRARQRHNIIAYLGYTLSCRAFCYFTMAQYSKGIEDMNQCLKLHPSHRHYYVQRAEGYRALGDEKRAHADLEHANSMPDTLDK